MKVFAPYRWIIISIFALLFGCLSSTENGADQGGSSEDTGISIDSQVCEPNCAGRFCGGDGCGGLCGECSEGQVCTIDFSCVDLQSPCGDGICGAGERCFNCSADCGVCCGDGACVESDGEHCGTCPTDCDCLEGQECQPQTGVCIELCQPNCEGRSCGSDGCNGSCGVCEALQFCDESGSCIDPPAGCGDDSCDEGEDCNNCVADCGCSGAEICEDARCVPTIRCGDNICDEGEDCSSCSADCGCPGGERCEDARCVPMERCGDSTCDEGEDCGNCPMDCSCPGGERCEDARCICTPQCAQHECGPDGCGGSCGLCLEGNCVDGRCELHCSESCGGCNSQHRR